MNNNLAKIEQLLLLENLPPPDSLKYEEEFKLKYPTQIKNIFEKELNFTNIVNKSYDSFFNLMTNANNLKSEKGIENYFFNEIKNILFAENQAFDKLIDNNIFNINGLFDRIMKNCFSFLELESFIYYNCKLFHVNLMTKSKENENKPLKECTLRNKCLDLSRKKKVEKEKRFICKFDNCQKKFEFKWILRRHLDSHFTFRLFKCDSCSKSYKSKENLNLHIKNKHIGMKPYNCDYCSSKFSHRNGKNTYKFINIINFQINWIITI